MAADHRPLVLHSRSHIPEPFQRLMIEPESPIIDFYPEEFDIDMNGKKMLWQGVALLPFIDPDRLLAAMGERYPELTEAEVFRNTMGSDVLFVSQDHPLYDYLEGLYTKRKVKDVRPFLSAQPNGSAKLTQSQWQSVELDTKRSKGIAGFVLPDPDCIPAATFDSPLPSLPDIVVDRSISASFSFPPQKTPHRSMLLPGVKKDRAVLTQYDKDTVRRGAAGGNDYGGGFHQQRQQNQSGPGFAKADRGGRNMAAGDGGRGGGGRSSYGPPQGSYNGSQGSYGGPPQGGRDPYSGYQPQQGGYGSYAGQQAYRPPPQQHYNGHQQPPFDQRSGPPPPGAYGAPPPGQQPPAYQGYGGYGGSGGGAPRGGGNNGGGQQRRY